MSIIHSLKNNSWETIQKVVRAGKVSEMGWSVCDTKTLTINSTVKTAKLIGINHDGENTATFMVDSIDTHVMNHTITNTGGWKDSEMREWLNTDIYNSMTDVKDYIKEVDKLTNNKGWHGTTENITTTKDKVFLLSSNEAGFSCPPWYSDYIDLFNNEGTPYEWFADGNTISDYFWLRSPYSDYNSDFFCYDFGSLYGYFANHDHSVRPVFVIG